MKVLKVAGDVHWQKLKDWFFDGKPFLDDRDRPRTVTDFPAGTVVRLQSDTSAVVFPLSTLHFRGEHAKQKGKF